MRKEIIFLILTLGLISSCGGKTQPKVDTHNLSEMQPAVPTTALEWTKTAYNDEFGQPTGSYYELTALEGLFSNSATTNSKLYVAIVVAPDSVVIFRLGEYGTHIVKNVDLKGKARDEHGSIVNFYLRADYDGWAAHHPVFTTDFVDMLASGERVDIVMTEDVEYGVPSTYRFTIPRNSGIREAMGRVH